MYQKMHLFSSLMKILIFSTPLLLVQSFSSLAQSLPSNAEIGFEVEGQSELNQIVIPLYRYVGECPSSQIFARGVRAWFTSSTEPPKNGRRVIIKNISRGMSPDNFPFTDREYNKGRASEATLINFGSKHSNSVFVVRENNNEFEYEIREKNSVVERGGFSAVVSKSSTVLEIPRNQIEVEKGYCRVNALFCPSGQWVSNKVKECPKDN